MSVDESVEAAQRIGLLEAAIGPYRCVEAFVAEEETHCLVFAWMRGQEQLGREVAERVRVEIDSRLSSDHAFDLGAEQGRSLGAAASRREQISVGILGEERPALGQVEIQKLAKEIRDLEREGSTVLHLFRRYNDVPHASRPGPNQVATEMERREVFHPHGRYQENPDRQRQLKAVRSGVTYRACCRR
jgi:hypothetical protein